MKNFARETLNRLGFKAAGTRRKPHKDVLEGFSAPYLARLSQPATVIDVGVGYGTYPLYEAFPKARFILVEPLRDYEGAISRIAGQYDCTVVYKAAGDAPGSLEISVDTENLQKSSFADRTPLTNKGHRLEKRMIEVATLDAIVAALPDLREPILLKIDTEGHELKALQGAHALLRRTDTVIVEASIARRFEGGYEFEDIVEFMKHSGFYLLTFLSINHHRGELRPRYADVVFKRRA